MSHSRTGIGRRWRKGGGALLTALALVFGTAAAAGAEPGEPNRSSSSDGKHSLSSFQHGTVPVEGGELHYVRGGAGPALVLLHGWPETWWSWREVMPELAKKHTVIAFDLPGLGQSGIFADGYDAAHTARRVHEGVTKLGHDKTAILSHDLGALVAYPYARDFPDAVSRMAVLETPLNGFGLEDAFGLSWHFGFNSTAKPVPENIITTSAQVRTYLGWLFSGARHPDRIDQTHFFRAYDRADRRSAGYNYYRAFTTNAADNKANAHKRLKMPVLAMGAQYVFGPGVAQSFKQVADDVRTVVAPDSGHWIPEENPRFLNDCASLFFGPANPAPPSPELASCTP